ncbi:MAG: M24 family metallopeptidase, partial [Thaumarchaeota archaeon]|nr:M24 family metallopeptidase [Nitrososphaerota archaeon]
YSDTGTTFVLGANPEAEKMYHTLWEVFESHLDLLAPGKKPSAILKAFGRSYEKLKMKGGLGYQGHAIGLQTREHPVIYRSEYKRIADEIVDISIDIPLEEGMVINIETPVDVLGKGSYQVERTFRITKDKPEELTPKRESAPHVIKEAAA